MKCYTCENMCDKIDVDHWYCCWCVPAEYIKKPVGEWMCQTCKNQIVQTSVQEFLEEARNKYWRIRMNGNTELPKTEEFLTFLIKELEEEK